jgi:hypothetical protein
VNAGWMLQETQAQRGPFSDLFGCVAEVVFFWARDCRLWVNYCLDANGGQVGETIYYPNITQAKKQWDF